jgi:hypothetical protein
MMLTRCALCTRTITKTQSTTNTLFVLNSHCYFPSEEEPHAVRVCMRRTAADFSILRTARILQHGVY